MATIVSFKTAMDRVKARNNVKPTKLTRGNPTQGIVHGYSDGFLNPIMTPARAVAIQAKLAVVEKQKAKAERTRAYQTARQSDPVTKAALESLLQLVRPTTIN